MASAISSLPVPVSPLINTVASVGDTICTMPSTFWRASLLPTIRGNPLLLSSLSSATFADAEVSISKGWLIVGNLTAQLTCADICFTPLVLRFRPFDLLNYCAATPACGQPWMEITRPLHRDSWESLLRER